MELSIYNLHAHAFGILHMKSGVDVFFRSQAAALEFLGHGFLVELLDAEGEMVHEAGRTFVVKRDYRFRSSHADDLVRFILTHDRQAEDIAVKRDRLRQICDLNADVIDLRRFEGGFL